MTLTRLLVAAVLAIACATPALAQGEQGGLGPSPPGTDVFRGGPVFPNPPANGPGVPRADIAEVMVRAALMTFNDANLTGNYHVLNARLHPEFARQAPAERLATIFQAFHTNKIDLGAILIHQIHYTKEPMIDGSGLLVTEGYFDTRPWRTNFNLAWRLDGNQWRLWRVNVNVKPPS